MAEEKAAENEAPPQLAQPDLEEEEEGGGGGAPLWMTTFSDLMTLLLCFFVLLFAMSTIQDEVFKEIIQSLRTALGVQTIPEAGTREGLIMDPSSPEPRERQREAVDELGAMVQKEVEEIVSDVRELVLFNRLGGMVEVKESDVGAVITISDMVLFRSGEATMVPEGVEIMAKLAEVLKQFRYPIRVVGHTDNVPITTALFPSNWELSTARAAQVVRFLIERGLNPLMLTAQGFAEYRPVDTNDNAQGRAKNRRVEVSYEGASSGTVLQQ